MRDELLQPGRPTRSRRPRRRRCGRAGSTSSSASRSSRSTSRSSSRRPAGAARPPTTCCSPGRPASARPRWPASSPPRWACALQHHVAARRSSGPATSPRSSPTSTTATCCSSTRSTACRAPVEEVLYPAMEDFQLDIVHRQGPGGALDPPRPAPLHARRRHHPHRPHHRPAARPLRLRRPARLLRRRRPRGDRRAGRRHPRRRRSTPAGAREIAAPGPGHAPHRQPAAARVRDFAEVRADGAVDRRRAHAGLALFGVDELGLDKVDRAILDGAVRALRRRAGRALDAGHQRGRGARDGRGRLRAVPPQAGLLQRTPRGRVATPAAYAHLHLPAPRVVPSLFATDD